MTDVVVKRMKADHAVRLTVGIGAMPASAASQHCVKHTSVLLGKHQKPVLQLLAIQ